MDECKPLVEDTLRCDVVDRDSLSYPGLPCRYSMNRVDARLSGRGFHSSTFSAQRKLLLWDMLRGVSLSVKSTALAELSVDECKPLINGLPEGVDEFTSEEQTLRGKLVATWVWKEGHQVGP